MGFLGALFRRWRAWLLGILAGIPWSWKWIGEQWAAERSVDMIDTLTSSVWNWMAVHPVESILLATCSIVTFLALETKAAEKGWWVGGDKPVDASEEVNLEAPPDLQSKLAQEHLRLTKTNQELEAVKQAKQACERAYGELRRSHALYRLQVCAYDQTLTQRPVVHVQYVHPDDRSLAESLRKLFIREEAPEFSTWQVNKVEQVLAKDNPSDTTKIMMFSDGPNADQVQVFINQFGLLGEHRIARGPKQPNQKEDILIMVFDHLRSDL